MSGIHGFNERLREACGFAGMESAWFSQRIMDHIKPAEVMENMLKTGAAKAALPPRDLMIRGFLSGALLAFATSLAMTATIQSGVPLVGALVFPVGFVIIVLLGLE